MVGELQAGHSRRARPYRLPGQSVHQAVGAGVEIECHRWGSDGCERGSRAAPFWKSGAVGRDSPTGYREVGIP